MGRVVQDNIIGTCVQGVEAFLPMRICNLQLGLDNRDEALVLLVSDTHGYLDVRIERLAARADIVIHAGDVGSWQVMSRLSEHCPHVLAIQGNNDTVEKWPERERERLPELPRELTVLLPGGALAAVHGDKHGTGPRRHARLRAQFEGARAVVFGHSHRRVIDRAASPLVLNPGAAGKVRTYGGPSCLLLTARASGRWTVNSRTYPPATT
jgi:putative phosphoesterase